MQRSWLSTKSGSFARHALNSPSSKPVRVTRLRYTAGMIWSVSTLLRRSGTAVPVCTVNLSMTVSYRSAGLARWPVTAVAAATSGDTRWVRPPLPCRPSKLRLDVRRAALAGRELVGVHAETHRAAGLPPLGAGRGEDRVEALLLGLLAHPHRARHDEHPHAVGDLAALDDLGDGAQVLDAAVRARADEDGVDLDVAQRRAGASGPCTASALLGRRRGRPRRRSSSGSGTRLGQRRALAGVGAPGDERRERRRRRA